MNRILTSNSHFTSRLELFERIHSSCIKRSRNDPNNNGDVLNTYQMVAAMNLISIGVQISKNCISFSEKSQKQKALWITAYQCACKWTFFDVQMKRGSFLSFWNLELSFHSTTGYVVCCYYERTFFVYEKKEPKLVRALQQRWKRKQPRHLIASLFVCGSNQSCKI